MRESGSKTQVWIAKNALKELENLLQVEERVRLISADSQMGMKKKEYQGKKLKLSMEKRHGSVLSQSAPQAGNTQRRISFRFLS